MATRAKTVYYYGKKTNFVGKTLFQILGNLRDFGVNRMVLKQEELLNNPGTKCYYIVKKVEPVMDDELKQGAIYAERVYRNARVPGLVFVDDETWHSDWQLVSKDQEDIHRIPEEELVEHGHPSTVKVLPRWMEVPPLMDLFLRRHIAARRGETDSYIKTDTPKLNIMMCYEERIVNQPHAKSRVAEEGETSHETINRPPETLLSPKFA